MSRSTRKGTPGRLRRNGPVFAALGDDTRLTLVSRLANGPLLSITRLTQGVMISRQAITKHLRVLEDVGLVRRERRGRESLFRLEPKPLREARDALEGVSRGWDEALARLKAVVEE